MLPTIRVGARLLVEEVSPDAIHAGDIIIYQKIWKIGCVPIFPKRAVTHRVIGIEGPKQERIFLTKGDNQFYIDADRIAQSDVIGRVVLKESRFAALFYVRLANAVIAMRRSAKEMPSFVRAPLKPLVCSFFFILKAVTRIIPR